MCRDKTYSMFLDTSKTCFQCFSTITFLLMQTRAVDGKRKETVEPVGCKWQCLSAVNQFVVTCCSWKAMERRGQWGQVGCISTTHNHPAVQRLPCRLWELGVSCLQHAQRKSQSGGTYLQLFNEEEDEEANQIAPL